MRLLAVDPGNEKSALLELEDGRPSGFYISSNDDVLSDLLSRDDGRLLAIEMIASYGMAVGREVFETCVWIGRFQQAFRGCVRFVYRRDVKLFLCQSARATDSNIRAALIDLYGPGKEKAIGTKRAPGLLYGMKGDMWSALAVALTAEHQIRSTSNAA